MAVEKQPLPVNEALNNLSAVAGKEPIPGLRVLNGGVTGNAGETLLLTAREAGANYLTGDPRVSSIRLTQVEVGGVMDTVLRVGRRNGTSEEHNTELVITNGRASVIKDNPGLSYSETPAGPRDEALVRRVLVNIATLQ